MPPDSSNPRVWRRRILSFLIVVSAILFGGTALVCVTLAYLWRIPGFPALAAIAFALTFGFVFASVMGRRQASPWISFVYRISAVWLGFLNYLFLAAIAIWIFLPLAALFSLPVNPRWVVGLFFGAAILTALYGFANAFRLRLTRVTVKLPSLPAAWRGRTVALVTDMHLGNVRGTGFVRKVASRLKQESIETVLISGDLFDGPESDYDALLQPWRDVSEAMTIYFVTGNHEEFSDREKYLGPVRRAGLHVLYNEKVDVDGLQFVGVLDGELHDREVYRALLRQARLDRSRPSILLAHQPLRLEIPEEAGVSLVVCGHTHGGQFWPWVHVAARVHGKFNHGLNDLGKLQVLTSNGVGTWGAPMRVGTKSEIVLIRLELESR